jgi:hypothetical protein
MTIDRDGEYFLKAMSGDEYFEVLGKDDSILRSGEEVTFNKGDRVRVMFNALHQSAREWADCGYRYVCEGILTVDEDGTLISPAGKFQAGVIDLYKQNGNQMEFGRVEA